jgi:hypothetical protein
VYQPYFLGRGVTVDSVTADYARMADRIASDISSGKALIRQQLRAFAYRWAPGIDLGTVTREIY